MHFRPSWWGHAGLTIVLAALPMQNHISPDIAAAMSSARPMPQEIHATADPPPISATPSDRAAPKPAPPPRPEPERAAQKEFIPDGRALEELMPDDLIPDAAEAAVGALVPSAGKMAVVGTLSAKADTWDTSAAALRLSHQEAARHLAKAGLNWTSTGRCTDRRRRSCTSLEDIRYGTLMRLIELKHASGCDITVTGGTETGHAPGRYSHSNGYKVDIAHNKCIDAYIRGKFRRWKTREDGSALYRPPSKRGMPSAPAVYADESTHWDILFL